MPINHQHFHFSFTFSFLHFNRVKQIQRYVFHTNLTFIPNKIWYYAFYISYFFITFAPVIHVFLFLKHFYYNQNLLYLLRYTVCIAKKNYYQKKFPNWKTLQKHLVLR